MSFIWIVLRATAVVGGLMAALVTGGIAHADTMPSLPGVGDLGAAVANAPQLLQSVGSALGVLPKPPAVTPPPLAGASVTVPQGAVPGLPGAPAPSASAPTAGIPGLPLTAPQAPASVPQVPSAVPGASANAPSAHVDMPQMPFLPLPQQLSLPGNLGPIAPGAVPLPAGAAPAPAIAAPAPVPTPDAFLSALP